MSQTKHREDHLKALYALGEKLGGAKAWVPTNDMASHLGVKAPSVTGMIQVLQELGWAEHRPYRGARLTDTGRNLALSLVRKHRLWETFLVDHLGFDWAKVHAIAEQMEHIDSVELVDRLDAFLGRPTLDPHGDPIPNANGHLKDPRELVPAGELLPGSSGVMAAVKNDDENFLKALSAQGLELGKVLKSQDLVQLPVAWHNQILVETEEQTKE